jgi:hypothetical protein
MPTKFLNARRNQCRFIPGEPSAEAFICGKPVQEGSSYCPECHSRLYRKVAMRGLNAVDYSVRRSAVKPSEDPIELTEVFAA